MNFIKLNKYIIISSILLISAIISNLFLSYYIIPKRYIGVDQLQHFYDMKRWYESRKIPTTSARFIASKVIDEEYTTARVPGGAYYIFYTLFYKLSNENLLGAKIINFIFNIIIISIFLFWFYKRFGLIITSFIAPLILCNAYFVMAITDFWNPNLSLIFGFLLFIFLFEYLSENEEDNKRKKIVSTSAVTIFPILAIMAQGHFFVFFSLIPTLIIYLIIKYKRTLKYIKFFSIGIFLSFLEYLPYLISEVQSNFSNLNMIFSTRSSFTKFPFPQIQALFIFPTNDISFFYGSKIYSSIKFWSQYPITILGLLFLFLSFIFVFISLIRSIYFSFLKKNRTISDNEKTIIEMVKIFLLFIPVTIIGNLFAGQFAKIHYLYQMFIFSFLPIILFFIQKENKLKINKFFYISSLLIFINIFVMSLELTTYAKNYEESSNYENTRMIIKSLFDNSKNNPIDLKLAYSSNHDDIYLEIAKVYFPDIVFNYVYGNTNMYIILNMVGASQKDINSISNYMNYINRNTILITNNLNLYLYKYIGNEPFKKP